MHSDFAAGHDEFIRRSYREASGPATAALARSGLTAEAVAGAARIVILQFWRNLGASRMDHPIAFCDARSVTPEDSRAFGVTDYAGSGTDFDALGIVRPQDASTHRWYTFPAMERDEAVAFRTYDSDRVRAGRTWFTPHSAFRDPAVPLGDPPRRSIELRATCVYL